jgi:hypothetical protein
MGHVHRAWTRAGCAGCGEQRLPAARGEVRSRVAARTVGRNDRRPLKHILLSATLVETCATLAECRREAGRGDHG